MLLWQWRLYEDQVAAWNGLLAIELQGVERGGADTGRPGRELASHASWT